MPVCRNCGQRISKLDKDICPICGTNKPLKDVESKTVEITSEIDIHSPEFSYHPKSRFVTFILFFLLGWTGAGFFYTSYHKKGLIWLLLNLVIFSSIGVLLALPLKFGWIWGLIIPFIGIYIINTLVGLIFLIKSDLKDGKGDFLV